MNPHEGEREKVRLMSVVILYVEALFSRLFESLMKTIERSVKEHVGVSVREVSLFRYITQIFLNTIVLHVRIIRILPQKGKTDLFPLGSLTVFDVP